MSLTAELGVFVNRVTREGTSPEAREAAKLGLIDCLGTMLAGMNEPATQTILEALSPLPAGHCSIGLGPLQTCDAYAALINGVAAHALDFDDVSLRGHPSAVMVPAILAVAQTRGSTGQQILDAYIAGYEVWGNLVDREKGMHPIKGWHTTGIFGSIGAAAACAVLYGLDAKQASHAIGLGASQSAGLMSNFGSMAKPLHAGHAAQAGVLAARLASKGFTASPDALEHEQGFLNAVSPKGEVDRQHPVKQLGKPFTIQTRRMNIKKYPTCYYTHRSLDGILNYLRKHPLQPEAIRSIEVTMSREHATILRNHQPQDGLAAKFSIEFAMACAVVNGRVGLTQLQDDVVQMPEIQRLMPLVHVHFSEHYDPKTHGAAYTDQVVITTADGKQHTCDPVQQATGHSDLPLTDEEQKAKFLDCLAYGQYRGNATALFNWLRQIEQEHISTFQTF